jgi:tRNA 2-selenouridine synthase
MPTALAIEEFLALDLPLLDCRSPGEYAVGHIPGALSFPLFSDEERAAVGTCYKKKGQEEAIELGLGFVGPKMRELVQLAKQWVPDRQVRLHCWRGGMRSSSMAWLLETAGFRVTLLKGGYKSFRTWALAQLAAPPPILTLGGMTGTGKTTMLYHLAAAGEQILDLEHYASHRGSSYGALGLPPQPSDEQFGNLIATGCAKLDPARPVWIEAESRRIGVCRVPDELFAQMTQAPVISIELSRQERVDNLLQDYGAQNPQELIEATNRLTRRIGGQNAQVAIDAIESGDLATAIHIVLDYYDKAYLYDLERRNVPIHSLDLAGVALPEACAKLRLQSQNLLASL